EGLLARADAANLIQYRDSLRFTHQRLHDYFATFPMREALEAWEKQLAAVTGAERFFDPWWEAGGWAETAVILGEVLRDPERVALWLAGHTPAVALEVVLRYEVGRQIKDLKAGTRAAIIRGLEGKRDEPNPQGRAVAWQTLGRLGADNR